MQFLLYRKSVRVGGGVGISHQSSWVGVFLPWLSFILLIPFTLPTLLPPPTHSRRSLSNMTMVACLESKGVSLHIIFLPLEVCHILSHWSSFIASTMEGLWIFAVHLGSWVQSHTHDACEHQNDYIHVLEFYLKKIQVVCVCVCVCVCTFCPCYVRCFTRLTTCFTGLLYTLVYHKWIE